MLDKKPIIHIGFPKTATTWLQQEFFPYVDNIDYIQRETISEKIVKPNTFEIDFDSTAKYFENRENKRNLICNEMLVGGMDAGFGNGAFIKEIGYRLKKIFNQAKIIIFIRNQHSIIASAYYQYIRSGGNYSIDKYLKRKELDMFFLPELSLFSFDFFKFDQTISFYKHLFGEENVDIYLYEDFLENPKSFLTNFKLKYNLEIDIDTLNFEKKKNNRYRIHLLRLAKITNSFTVSNTLLKYYIFNIPKFFILSHNIIYKEFNKFKIFGKYPNDLKLLRQRNIDYINDYYKKSNLNLINNHGLESIKKYKYPL